MNQLEQVHGLEGVPGLPGAPQDEAGLTRKFETSHVGGATCRTPPIPRSALENDPRPGPLFEGPLRTTPRGHCPGQHGLDRAWRFLDPQAGILLGQGPGRQSGQLLCQPCSRQSWPTGGGLPSMGSHRVGHASTRDEALIHCTKPSGVQRGPSQLHSTPDFSEAPGEAP